ncbi:GGDEF domain-containing protein [Oceanispirochaeta sp.]|jgi:diguanylate cyclase (GGDEF)-like protein|uniref:GGDEF domain-containing protein n=1 Tax=Oceanispirochaeta sp. TaxID=2035350 RepID=UPI00261ECF96|nr:GGDEF domain-containing protein [Oceanispirochaeta sp.]MDA3957467.1 GGDEF domain-containing protein [Oceanispirochaeta sp.]
MTKKLAFTKPVLLKQTDIFSSLQTHELRVIAKNSEFRIYQPGETVFKTGEPGNALYIVESGEVVVQKQEEYGPVIDFARFIQGNCFGELDMFTETNRVASAVASGETRLLVFPKSGTSFEEILKELPEISARILHKILVNIAERIRSANSLIKENSPLMQELKKQVYRDKLTGIFNQTYLLEKIRKFINNGNQFALIISKPDNFKDLNDNYGHEIGDLVLKMMARLLRDFIGDDSRTVRYKGNAMAVLLMGASRKEAYEAGLGIRDFLNQLDVSEVIGGVKFQLTASVGISLFPDHASDPETLVFNTHELPLKGRTQGGNLILFPEDNQDTE